MVEDTELPTSSIGKITLYHIQSTHAFSYSEPYRSFPQESVKSLQLSSLCIICSPQHTTQSVLSMRYAMPCLPACLPADIFLHVILQKKKFGPVLFFLSSFMYSLTFILSSIFQQYYFTSFLMRAIEISK